MSDALPEIQGIIWPGDERLPTATPKRARRAKVARPAVEQPKRWWQSRARTGSGVTRSADNILMHQLANLGLILGVIAGGVGSVDGLLAAAEIAFKPGMHWVLPVALDVFLVGTAIATLALRERRAWVAVVFCVIVTLGLVGFSAVVNFTFWQSITDPGTLSHDVGPFIKGSMPVLLLIALEILAAINTTKRRVTPTSVTKLRAELQRLKGEGRLRSRIASLKAKRAARA